MFYTLENISKSPTIMATFSKSQTSQAQQSQLMTILFYHMNNLKENSMLKKLLFINIFLLIKKY